MIGPQVTESTAKPLCQVNDIPDGGAFEVAAELDDGPADLVLLRAGEHVRAFHNICPHAGRPLNWAPGKFLVESNLLICAAHGASFSIPEGRCVGGPCRGAALREVAVQVVESVVRLVPLSTAD